MGPYMYNKNILPFFLNVSFNMQLNRKMDKCVAYQVVKLYHNDNNNKILDIQVHVEEKNDESEGLKSW